MTDARLVGEGLLVPLVTGESVPYLNLDSAASTSPLHDVENAVREFLPWYSSVHRGQGLASQVSTRVYEAARVTIARFVGARPDDTVIFTRNTTDALNMLSTMLPARARVVTFDAEHHANLLPWRRHDVTHLPTPRDPSFLAPTLAAALGETDHSLTLVALTAASNVTGELLPVKDLVALAHRLGAYVVVDAAQLAPHAPVDVADLDADWLVLSGHKMYAPFGAGALIGRQQILSGGAPHLRGGGAVDLVTNDTVTWSDLPDLQEAGSPNVVGAFAMAVAAVRLMTIGMETIAREEQELVTYALERLSNVPGLRILRIFGRDHPRVGTISFTLDGWNDRTLASALSAEHGIGVRHGRFCAHPLVLRLLDVPSEEVSRIQAAVAAGDQVVIPGAVRVSFGLATGRHDVDRVTAALVALAEHGCQWTYAPDENGAIQPVPDPRIGAADLGPTLRGFLDQATARL